jgi:hypothetical protein
MTHTVTLPFTLVTYVCQGDTYTARTATAQLDGFIAGLDACGARVLDMQGDWS